jgi:hypothetical protein
VDVPNPPLWPVMPWGPTIDGSNVGLLDLPLNLLKKGKFNKVPVIFGTNKNEGTIFVPLTLLIVPGSQFPPNETNIVQGAGRGSHRVALHDTRGRCLATARRTHRPAHQLNYPRCVASHISPRCHHCLALTSMPVGCVPRRAVAAVVEMLDMFPENETAPIAQEALASYYQLADFPNTYVRGVWTALVGLGWLSPRCAIGRLQAQAAAMLTDFIFTCSTRRAARAIASFGVPAYL